MWQLICLCLPPITTVERQRLFLRLHEALQAHEVETSGVDIGLAFLQYLTPDEALLVLQVRRELVRRSQIFLAAPNSGERSQDDLQFLVEEHIRILLEAEMAWLEQAIGRLDPASPAKTEPAFANPHQCQ